MRQSDADTIEKLGENGGKILIGRAAKAIFSAHDNYKRCAIVCADGNNGSDGLALALIIKEHGGEPTIIKTSEKCTPDGQYFLNLVKESNIPVIVGEFVSLKGYDTVVDCLFGTGFKGAPRGFAKDLIEEINQSGAFVISADINSGLNAENGTFSVCVKSDLTVSIGYLKPGHFLGDAKDVIGRLVNYDIGIEITENESESKMFLVSDQDFSDILRKRKNNSHKGTYGYVCIMGGCTQFSGAVKLANLASAAMRSGAGVVKLAVEGSLASSVSPYLLESTLCPMSGEGGKMAFDLPSLENALAGVCSVSVGMGWGDGVDYPKILEYLMSKEDLRLIIDADGINTLAKVGADVLKQAKAKIAITPHPKEFSRISGLSMQEIMADPIKCAEDFAKEYGVVVLLKGASTVITDGATTLIESGGCAGMATAGSGDVLSGVLCALHGYNEVSVKSVACGAHICAKAGELAKSEFGDTAMIASDTAKNIGLAVKVISERGISPTAVVDKGSALDPASL